MRPAGTANTLLERGGYGLLAFVVLLVLLFDVLPATRLLLAAFAPGGAFAPEAALAVLASRSTMRAIVATLETSFASSILALLLGGLMALCLGVTDMRGRRPASFLFVLSMMVESDSRDEREQCYELLIGRIDPISCRFRPAPEPAPRDA